MTTTNSTPSAEAGIRPGKVALRQQFLAELAAWGPPTDFRLRAQANISAHLKCLLATLFVSGLRLRLAVYRSVGFEVDLRAFCEYRKHDLAWEFYCPRIISSEPPVMAMLRLDAECQWELNALGIEEPKNLATVIAPQDLDVIVVPFVASDLRGARLGRGRGYYDRYLLQTSAVRVGVGWARQLVRDRSLAAEEHDQKLDWIVTEEEILQVLAGATPKVFKETNQ